MAITDEIPKSRLTLTYRTTVRGEPEDVTLPFRVLIMGDLSGGTSNDRKVDIDKRSFRKLDGKNLDQIIKDMGISVRVTVPNRIDPDKSEEMTAQIPIRGMRSFTPAEVAKNVPKVKALLLLKKLLLEVQSNMDNRKDFRRLLRELSQDKDAVNKLLAELKDFEDFKIPEGGKAEDGGAASAAPEGDGEGKKKGKKGS